MCMNTFGILPPEIQGASLKEMMLVTGPGGKMIVGCWWRGAMESMGWPQLYQPNPQLTLGQAKVEDFDFAAGNFVCSAEGSEYRSHWWTAEELEELIKKNAPCDPSAVTVSCRIYGCGIFAIADIAADAVFTS